MEHENTEIKIALLERSEAELQERVKDLEKAVEQLKSFQKTVMVVFTSVAMLVGFFATWIREHIFGIK